MPWLCPPCLRQTLPARSESTAQAQGNPKGKGSLRMKSTGDTRPSGSLSLCSAVCNITTESTYRSTLTLTVLVTTIDALQHFETG